MCGEVEPHAIRSDLSDTYCEPTESALGMARLASSLLFGLQEAENLGFDEQRIRDRMAELKTMVKRAQPKLYQPS